jgi:predicted GIY-YIG superfamily endonuclease
VPYLTENTVYLGYKDQIMARVRKHTPVFVYGACYVCLILKKNLVKVANMKSIKNIRPLGIALIQSD